MSGYVTEQSGRWYAVVDMRATTGKRAHYRCRSKEEAEAMLRRLQVDVDNGTYVPPTQVTVAEFAYDWLQLVKHDLAPNTWTQYETSLRLHAMPALANIRLSSLTPIQVKSMLNGLHDHLSPKSVKHVHTALRRCLNQAVEWGVLQSNPVGKVKAPKVPPRELEVWTPAQAQAFLDEVQADRMYAVYYLAITTGLRRGEILGLKWHDVDFRAGRLTVQRALVPEEGKPALRDVKTPDSKRSVAVSADTLAVLQQHRERQAADGTTSPDGLIFTSTRGTPVNTSTLGKEFRAHLEAGGLPRIRFHDLRHTHATFLLGAGYSYKVVQERLGHKDARTTLNVYSHVSADLQKEAASAVEDLLKHR